MRKSVDRLLVFAIAFAIALTSTACGKLTPSMAGPLISKDNRTVFVKLRTGKLPVGRIEQRFIEAGLTAARNQPGVQGTQEAEIVLTPDGKQLLQRARAVACGPNCWNVPLGERTDVTVIGLHGSQELTESVTFTWKLEPNDLGERFGLEEKEYEGTAEFRREHGHWKLVSVDDDAPVI
jgi:hypothetical protein